MTWEPEVEEIKHRRDLAARMGGDEFVAQQHADGKLTVRERIERLSAPGRFMSKAGSPGPAFTRAESSRSSIRPALLSALR